MGDKILEEILGDDYRAGLLVLDICHAMEDEVPLLSAAITIIKMVSDKTGMTTDEVMQIIDENIKFLEERSEA